MKPRSGGRGRNALTELEVRHFRTFLAVAETENFTRAAERLELSQPTVSQQMKELETSLGGLLFHRSGARVRLTDAGRSLRERAAALLGKFDEVRRPLFRASSSARGHVAVGVIPALGLSWMPGTLARLAREHPGITVSLREARSDEVESKVEAGILDLGIGLLARHGVVRHERLAGGEMVAIVPRRHALARARSIQVSALADELLVLQPQDFLMRELVDHAFRRARLRPRVQFEVESIDTLLATSLRCGMPTLLPKLVLVGREALDLRAVPIERWTPRVELGLMWPGGASPVGPSEHVAAAVRGELDARVRRVTR